MSPWRLFSESKLSCWVPTASISCEVGIDTRIGSGHSAYCALGYSVPGVNWPIGSTRRWFQPLGSKHLRLRDWRQLNTAIRRLDTIGRTLLQVSLGSTGTSEVSAFLKRHVAHVFKGFKYSAARRAPIVELHTCLDPRRQQEFSELVPIEFLPLLGAPDVPHVVDHDSLIQTMARFVGMFAVVRRTGLWQVDERQALDGRNYCG